MKNASPLKMNQNSPEMDSGAISGSAIRGSLCLVIGIAILLCGCVAPPLQPLGGNYALRTKEFNKCIAAAKLRDGKSCYRLHLHYSIALRDDVEGDMWLRRSAEYGYPAGMYAYGVNLWNQSNSVSQNETAKKWIVKAAKAGDESARNFLRGH